MRFCFNFGEIRNPNKTKKQKTKKKTKQLRKNENK